MSLVEMPIRKQILSFEEAVEIVKRKDPVKGFIMYDCSKCGESHSIAFGELMKVEAVWMLEAEKLNIMLADDENV